MITAKGNPLNQLECPWCKGTDVVADIHKERLICKTCLSKLHGVIGYRGSGDSSYWEKTDDFKEIIDLTNEINGVKNGGT